LPQRKKTILLNDQVDYPEGDPTPFARVGARPRQFVVELGQMFRRRGLAIPRIAYQSGEPLVQRIQGSETHFFRFSWWKKADGSENFPYPKDRSSLFNHAEDAAILAGVPPHTWREQVKCHTAERLNREGKLKPRPDLVLPELAPDWAGFLATRKKPMVRILGRYPVTWKSSFADQTFWREPENLAASKIRRSKLVRELTKKDVANVSFPQARQQIEAIVRDAGLPSQGTVVEALARQIAGAQAKRSAVQQAVPQAAEKLDTDHPEIRRVQVNSQKGGSLAQVRPRDGPVRKVQIKPASEGAIVWQRVEGKKTKKPKIHISLLRPRPLQQLGFPRVDPAIPCDATVLGQFRRHQIVFLEREIAPPGGFFRVTKLQEGGITVEPEEAVPAEILRRIEGGATRSVKGNENEEDGDGARHVQLGKEALAQYFATRNQHEQSGR
jgi:hypothetical protein